MHNRSADSGPPSIFDVARHAMVSASTVSRALRGMPNVAAATRARVVDAAAELGYVASPAASGLASGRTSTVAVVLPYVSRWFFLRVVQGAEHVLRDAGYDLLLYNFGDANGRNRFFDRLPIHRKVDAALLVDIALKPAEQDRLGSLGIPVTVVGGDSMGMGSVEIDEAGSVRAMVQHLAALGHRQVGMVCGQPSDGLVFRVPEARRRGFLDAAAAVGIETRPEWMVTATWGLEGGAAATEALLANDLRPTAIFAESDEMAFGALRVLRAACIDVPGEMSVAGFDDHEMASVVDLTTIAQPVHEMGATAASLLLDALAGHIDPSVRVKLSTHLVTRGTTAPPPA